MVDREKALVAYERRKEKRNNQLFDLQPKEWIAITISLVSLMVSMTTVYFSNLRVVDDFRLQVELKSTRADDADVRIAFLRDDIGLLFINSGSRPVMILSSEIVINDDLHNLPTLGRLDICRGTNVRTNFEPFVLKEKEVTRKAVRATLEGAKLMFPMPSFSENPDHEYQAAICLKVGFATPSRGDLTAFVQLVDVLSKRGWQTVRHYLSGRPEVLFRERRTVLFGD